MTTTNLRSVCLTKLCHRVLKKQAAMIRRAGPWNSWQFRGALRF